MNPHKKLIKRARGLNVDAVFSTKKPANKRWFPFF
jgi:hypothetical protein